MVTQNRIIEVEYRPIEKTDPCLTSEEKDEMCCGAVENDNPITCCEVVSIWHGYTNDEFRSIKGIPDEYEVRPLARQYPCGEQSKKPDLYQRQCCEGVTALSWDEDDSATVIAETGKALVYVNNGKPPFTWKVRGDGFYTNVARNQTEITTYNRGITVYTYESCGTAIITVTDSCNTDPVEGFLRSTNGTWELIEYWEDLADGSSDYVDSPCIDGDASIISTGPGNNYTSEIIKDEFKLVEEATTKGIRVTGSGCTGSNPITVYCPDAAVLRDTEGSNYYCRLPCSYPTIYEVGCWVDGGCNSSYPCTDSTCTEYTYCFKCDEEGLRYVYLGGGRWTTQSIKLLNASLYKWVC